MRPQSVHTPADARAYAERWLQEAVLCTARCFNLADDPRLPYQWDAPTRREAERLCVQLMLLADRGTLELRTGAAAQDDAQVQRFLATMIGQARR